MIEKHSQLHEGDNNLSVSSGDPEVAKDVSEAVLSIPAFIGKVVPDFTMRSPACAETKKELHTGTASSSGDAQARGHTW